MDVVGPVLSTLKAGWKLYQDYQGSKEEVKRSMREYDQVQNSLRNTHVSLKRQHANSSNAPYITLIRNLAKEMEKDAEFVRELWKKWRQKDFATFLRKLKFMVTDKAEALNGLVTELSRQNILIAIELEKIILNNVNPSIGNTPSRLKINILFLDDRNRGRSLAAQSYAQLLQSKTNKAKQPWNINKINSAGLYVEHKSELVHVQEILKFNMQPGNDAPFKTALACVFDNQFYFPDNAKIHQRFQTRKARGLAMATFDIYDYIFVFVPHHKLDLEKLIMEPKKRYGTAIVPVGKANVVLLGSFDNTRTDLILNPKKEEDPQQTRKNWNNAYKKIRDSFQGWLENTQEWWKAPKKKT